MTAIIGGVLSFAQAVGLTIPAMNDAATNREKRTENVGELRRCIAERNEFKADWKECEREDCDGG